MCPRNTVQLPGLRSCGGGDVSDCVKERIEPHGREVLVMVVVVHVLVVCCLHLSEAGLELVVIGGIFRGNDVLMDLANILTDSLSIMFMRSETNDQ